MPAPVVPPSNGRFAPGAVVVLTVLVFGAVVALVTLRLRDEVRAQLLRGAADQLAAVATMQLDNRLEEMGPGSMAAADLPGALLLAALKTSKFPGVAAVRVFDNQRRHIIAWPVAAQDEPAGADWAEIQAGRSVARLHRAIDENTLATLALANPEPVIEAWVPLRQSGAAMIGAAQFWVRGENFINEMAEHDRRLWFQATTAWLMGAVVIVVGLSWAFRRLAAANAALRARSEDLQRANRELVLAAKTSALGAVTAHLMHELKNPLAGLEVLMAGQVDAAGDERAATGGEMAAASELTRRLRTMVNDVVGVLRDEQTGAEFELTAGDVVEVAVRKVQREASERGVTIEAGAPPPLPFAGRRANLAILVLRNLLQNALEATPRGGTVRVTARAESGGGVEFLVEDGGAGLPAAVRGRLFQPCASTKVGGSGLGLALSHQLAQQAGGRLELVRSDEQGTSFRLVLTEEA